MAKKWVESDNGFVNSKGQIGVWVDVPDTPKAPTNAPSTPVNVSTAAVTTPVKNPYESYYNKIMEMYNANIAADRERQERVKQSRISNANKVYDTSINNLNKARENSLREAYIQNMKDQKALPQQMQAFGMSGGATETTLAGIKNAYGSNRTNIMNKAMEQQNLIEQDRANAIASAEADAANYEANAVKDYNNGLISMYASMLNNLPKYNNTTSSKTDSSSKTNITKNPWYNIAVSYLNDENNNYTTSDVITLLKNRNVPDDVIDSIMSYWESTF